MRKYVITLLTLLSVMTALAQEGEQNIGLTVGYANPIMRERKSADDTKLSDKTTMYGLKAGVVYEATFIKGFGMMTGLNYTFGANGGKWMQDLNKGTSYRVKSSWYYQQIELPIDWQYKFQIAKNTYLSLYTGPTIQVGLSLKSKNYVEFVDKTTLEKVSTVVDCQAYSHDLDDVVANSDLDDKYDYNRLNITWGVGLAFQYDRYFIRGGYDFGIYNIYHDNYNDLQSFNRRGRFDQWQIKLGIYLWQL